MEEEDQIRAYDLGKKARYLRYLMYVGIFIVILIIIIVVLNFFRVVNLNSSFPTIFNKLPQHGDNSIKGVNPVFNVESKLPNYAIEKGNDEIFFEIAGEFSIYNNIFEIREESTEKPVEKISIYLVENELPNNKYADEEGIYASSQIELGMAELKLYTNLASRILEDQYASFVFTQLVVDSLYKYGNVIGSVKGLEAESKNIADVVDYFNSHKYFSVTKKR